MTPEHELTIAFIGNPNCGKTTLFNAYTGANLKVANWPGVTVEKVEGEIRDPHDPQKKVRLIDLPGTYSLTSYTMEERVSRRCILKGEVDVVINVVDASALEHSLYLTLQLLELGKPVVLALNMMDVVEKRGMDIDCRRLEQLLGIPVLPVSARRRAGLDVLLHAAVHYSGRIEPDREVYGLGSMPAFDIQATTMRYSPEIESQIEETMRRFLEAYPKGRNVRWHAMKLLQGDDAVEENHPGVLPEGYTEENARDFENEVIREKFQRIEGIIDQVVLQKSRQDRLTDRVDAVLTHPVWGIPVFLIVMAAVFALTFTLGDWLKSFIELGIAVLSEKSAELLSSFGASEAVASLLLDGALGGVGTIVSFLPNIFFLFLSLAFLEDSGYMARVAYVMDGIMSRLGLSGRAFIPMLLGFGCTVPAIMASRALENRRDRFKVMLVTPFMSCSARLTIYILFAEMFFGSNAGIAAYSMYIIGILVAISILAGIKAFEKIDAENWLLIELPDYKMPDARTVAIYVWEKIKDYLGKAGTTIFAATIVIWALLNFGPNGWTSDMSQSFGASLGRALVPLFEPAGLGFWQISLALIAGISAKEVVVSSCAILFGVLDAESASGMSAFAENLRAIGFGPLNAFCLMVFCLLYTPCAATLATIRRESGSWTWTGFTAFVQLAAAWLVSCAIWQTARLFVG